MSMMYGYTPNKYKGQAGAYAGMVSKVNSSLGTALGELGNVDKSLGFTKQGMNDLLTTNVLASSEEVKTTITTVQSSLSKYATAVAGKAKTLDDEEYQAYLAALRRNKSKEEQNQGDSNTITEEVS